MRNLLRSQDQRSRPNTQHIAYTMSALAQLKHVPSQDVVTALFDRLVALCQTPALQPNSQPSVILYKLVLNSDLL